MDSQQIINTYDAGRVVRYHTHKELCRVHQNDADHQWGVATLILCLHPDPSKELIIEALSHDNGERWVGDTPGPVKWNNPVLGEDLRILEKTMRVQNTCIDPQLLSDVDRAWLKLCDGLECFFHVAIHKPEILFRDSWVSMADSLFHMADKIGGVDFADQIRNLINDVKNQKETN